ncbi:helix-turn-helix domain-containing protein [Methylobacterium haplocladii]|uniref:HTH cro/C1-type domain-containing protein n=1 Tax=Methylobacterium haplocladii TaxID=1176176 RepID=A0A512IS87_9HYPH|nr:helix-turn-helix transcriptional regulator [Methylobacterium haplocladii]GEP00572.1 hypothetical protein MHA02_29590 [Methylobacterium haplocladii]GJD85487.1 hypothetical protein HPGCJGGD_3376 [Methylobacterium haplocladii]GLS57720.1 hypothetical protein GCM10007887_03760 [Methylobacterium haplocladii]
MAGHPPTAIDVRVGRRLAEARKAAGLSCKEIGAVLGISASLFWRYETGQRRISVGHMQMVADLLYLPVTTFFDPPAPAGVEPPSPALSTDAAGI